MKINRYFSSRIIGGILAASFALVAVAAHAQQAAQIETPMIIRFSPSEGLRAEQASSILATRLHINAANDELRSAYIEQPGDGLQVQRFHQYFKGIRVAHGSYTLTSKDGIASYAFGKFYPLAAVTSTIPQIDEATALSSALSSIHAEKYAWDFNKEEYPKATLSFVEDFNSGTEDGMLHLAYAFDIYAAEPMSRNMVYVDAQNGKVLLTDAILKHAVASGSSLYSDTVAFNAGFRNGKYYLHDSTRGTGIFTYNLRGTTYSGSGFPTNYVEDSSFTSFFAKDPAIDAHWGAARVYDYWKTAHNRNSWNGSNGVLRSYVHYGNNYNNAFWNGSAMFYGDGSGVAGGGFPPLTALDVCGHEIGHGVCQSTAGLIYSREAGAMNEGFSDIWGAVIEAYGDPHEKDAIAKNPWLIGEELTNTLRSMSNPKLYGQPNCYQGDYWICTSTTCANIDNWGVHYNSGVLNYWFYLLSVGGKGTNDLNNPFKVSGIGMAKAAKIAYATELTLNSSANYAACRVASIAAATALYGACSPEVEAVTHAWYAVGVGLDYTPCTPQVSFNAPVSSYTEDAGVNACKPTHMISVPVVLNGTAAIAGDSAVVTAMVVGGTAVAGVDYDLSVPKVTFTVGGSSTQAIQLTVYDNGVVGTNKYVDLIYTLVAGGSNVTRSAVLDTTRIYINEDDRHPDAGGAVQNIVLSSTTVGNASSPFYSSARGARIQYIYKASELAAAGIRSGMPLTAAEFFVINKYSTLPFNGYTMKLANTPQSSLASGFISASFTTVYSANLTTAAGWNSLPFSAPFIWNGTDNIAIEICFTNSAAPVTGAANDQVQAQFGGPATYAASTTTTNGCALASNVTNLTARPIIRFTQDVAPTPVETALSATRTWNVKAAELVYFYSDGAKKLLAAVENASDSLGCVTTKITASGDGFVPANSGGAKRSIKEFSMTPTAQLPRVTYDATFYVTNAELAGTDPASIRIVQSNTSLDAEMLPGNTNIITPTSVFTGTDYTGFRGTFTGFGRFFLINGSLALDAATITRNSALWTGANPFHTAPVLYWNLAAAERVSIRLYDVTGKLVYGTEQTLASGIHQMSISGSADVAPGTYVLQVVRPSGVFTRQLVKQ